MGATTQLMTFAEFEKLPDDVCRHSELRHGELVFVPPPRKAHVWLQQRIAKLLIRHADDEAVVGMEIPFRPLAEHEFYKADVAYVSEARWRESGSKGDLLGSPELVIEVLSPSNTSSEMNDRKTLCLDTGCREFWVIDPWNIQVDVSTPDGQTVTYRRSQSIPLPLFGGATLAVDEIFRGLD